MSETYEMQGLVKVVFDTQTYASGFEKREFVITTNDKYPQDVKFEVIKDNVSLLDGVNPGDELNVKFNVKGNEYNERFFVNLQCWKLEMVQAGNSQPAHASPEPQQASNDDIFGDDSPPF